MYTNLKNRSIMIPSIMSKLCWRYFFGFIYRARDLYEHNALAFYMNITHTRFVVLNRARILLNSNFYSLQMIRPSLHPCFRGIPLPMCLLCTLLQIQHACALEYDKPWQIQHYIHIFNMLMFNSSSDCAAHLHFL